MEDLAEIILEDNGRKIKFNKEVIEIFKKYRQFKCNDFEAGGMLIGREDINNGNIIVEYITIPLKSDIRKKYRFYRKDKGHIEFYEKLYEENNGIYVYIGEWHTHPEDYPIPSSIDKSNWKKILKGKGDKEVTFNVIVGIKEIRIWKCNKKIERIY